MRNLGGDVTSYLEWDDRDADILGDWATPADEEQPAPKRPRGRQPSKSTRQKFYRANSPQDEQIEVRTRFYMAVAAAIQAFGVTKLTWESTWRDLIPPWGEAPPLSPSVLRPPRWPRPHVLYGRGSVGRDQPIRWCFSSSNGATEEVIHIHVWD